MGNNDLRKRFVELREAIIEILASMDKETRDKLLKMIVEYAEVVAKLRSKK